MRFVLSMMWLSSEEETISDPSKMYIEPEDRWPSFEEETMSVFEDNACCCSLPQWLSEPALFEGNFGVS